MCLGNFRGWASGRTPKHPHHLTTGVVVRLLEFVFDRHNLDLEANPLQVLEDGADVGRPVAVEAVQRVDANLACHPQQLLEGGNMEIAVELAGIQEQ